MSNQNVVKDASGNLSIIPAGSSTNATIVNSLTVNKEGSSNNGKTGAIENIVGDMVTLKFADNTYKRYSLSNLR